MKLHVQPAVIAAVDDCQTYQYKTFTSLLDSLFFASNYQQEVQKDSFGLIWDCAQTSYDTGNKTVARNGVSAFSNWAIGNNVSPTDVTLGDLSARTHSSLPVVWVVGLLGAFTLSVAIFRRLKRNKITE